MRRGPIRLDVRRVPKNEIRTGALLGLAYAVETDPFRGTNGRDAKNKPARTLTKTENRYDERIVFGKEREYY